MLISTIVCFLLCLGAIAPFRSKLFDRHIHDKEMRRWLSAVPEFNELPYDERKPFLREAYKVVFSKKKNLVVIFLLVILPAAVKIGTREIFPSWAGEAVAGIVLVVFLFILQQQVLSEVRKNLPERLPQKTNKKRNERKQPSS